MTEKETIMKLKVNLQCEKCYKKVKKVLSKFPQIRDQTHLVKDNLVVIKVACCNPEKIRERICCKGDGAIKTIEIVEPPKSKPPQEKRKQEPEKTEEPEKKQDAEKPPESNPPPPPVETKPGPVASPPSRPVPVPMGVCCVECYEGRPGGPCFQGYGGLPICYCGFYGRPVYGSCGRPRPYYLSCCDQCFSDENASGCSIM